MAFPRRLPDLSCLPGAALLALPLLLASPRAEACGGLFCDSLPDPMPVDQNAEDILFVSDGENIEVHIRIAYVGEAERFAWVVPIQAIPEVDIGSDAMFNAMATATGARWRKATTYQCSEDEPPPPPDDDWDTAGGESGDNGGGPEVVFEETVGAFEVVVLQGGTAAEVVDFLNENNYAQDPDSEPILQEYLDEDFLFAAVKLTADAMVSEIHPLVFKFPGTEPCVPIRLTRIAAQPDMHIRTYFLADDRWAPTNYAHVVPNPLALDWSGGSHQSKYTQLISQAMDDAGGRAFVTEYSGTSNAVNQNSIHRASWDSLDFTELSPAEALQEIVNVGLIEHPLMVGILLQYIPPPDGLDATEFWNFIFSYEDLIDLEAWDPVAFGDTIEERIVAPGRNAADLLDAYPTLTRLVSIMSPEEMLEDPMFHANPDLPDVDSERVTEEELMCGLVDRQYYVDIEDITYRVCVPGDAAYPEWEMPAALRIEQIPMMGPPQVTTDNSAEIDALFDSYDESVTCMGVGGTDDGTEGGVEGGDEDGNSSTSGGDSGGLDDPETASCGCSTPKGEAPVGAAFGLLVLGLIGPWRRRSR